MALFQPGPFISSLHGTIGGGVAKKTPHGWRLQSWRKPRHRPTYASTASKTLFSRAAAAWSDLAPLDRAAWDNAAEAFVRSSPDGLIYNPSGQNLHAAAWLKQRDVPTLAAPSPVHGLVQPSPPLITAALDTDYLRATRLSRTLTTGEVLTIRVLDTTLQTRAAGRDALTRTAWTNSLAGLGPYDQNSVLFDSGTDYGVSWVGWFTSNQFTFDLWLYLRPPQSYSLPFIFAFQNLVHRLICQGSPTPNPVLYLRSGADYRTIGPAPSANIWHYLAFVFDTDAQTLTTYLDGAPYGNIVAYTGTGSTIQQHWMGWSAPGNQLHARLDNVRVSNIARSPATIAAAWNYGAGTKWTSDANTYALWACDTNAGGIVPDDSGHNQTLTVINTTLALGFNNTALVAPAETPLPAARRTHLRTNVYSPTCYTAKFTRAFLDW